MSTVSASESPSGADLSAWRIGAITAAWTRFPRDVALREIAKLGLEYVELVAIRNYVEHFMPEHVASGEAERTRALLDELGLRAISLSVGADLTTEDGAAHLAACIDTAPSLGIRYLNNGSGSTDTPEGVERFLANMAELAPRAEAAGVTIGLETQDALTADWPALVDALERIDSPSVRVNLDPANMIYWQGKRPEEQIELLAPYVAHVHMKDHAGGRGEYDFPTAGQGDIDFTRLYSALLATGFSGPIILDNEFWREEAKTDAERAESLADPAATYSRPHGYLGTDDLDVIHAGMSESLEFTRRLLAAQTVRENA